MKNYIPKYLKYRLLKYKGLFTQYLLGAHSKAIISESEGLFLAVAPNDMSVGRSLRENGAYATEELNYLRSLITNDSNVVIVGTHVGAIALPLSLSAKNVFCFEANPNTYPLLNLNIRLNEITNVTPFNIAVGEDNGSIEFIASNVFSGGAKRKPLKNITKYNWDNSELVKVPMKMLDSIEHLSALDSIALLLIDIEGSELFALKGAQHLMPKVEQLIVEFIPHHLDNVANATVNDFMDLIEPYFNSFKTSTSEHYVSVTKARDFLIGMYQKGEGDPGILFSKQNSSHQ